MGICMDAGQAVQNGIAGKIEEARKPAGGSCLQEFGHAGLITLVPIVMVSGRLVLSRRVFVPALCSDAYSVPSPRSFSVDFPTVTDSHDGHQMLCVIHLIHNSKGPYSYAVQRHTTEFLCAMWPWVFG